MAFIYECDHDERATGSVASLLYFRLQQATGLEVTNLELRVACLACSWRQPREPGRPARLRPLRCLADPEAPTNTLSLLFMFAHAWARLRLAPTAKAVYTLQRWAEGGLGLNALLLCMERAARDTRAFKVQLYRLVSGHERFGLYDNDGRAGPVDLLGLSVGVDLLENAALAAKGTQERLMILWVAWCRWASKYDGVVVLGARPPAEEEDPE